MRNKIAVLLFFVFGISSLSAYDVYTVQVFSGAREPTWTKMLAREIGEGDMTRKIPYLAPDFVTNNRAYEVNFIETWHEGFGQVLHARDVLKKQGVLVLIVPNLEESRQLLTYIEKERCEPYDIELIVIRKKLAK